MGKLIPNIVKSVKVNNLRFGRKARNNNVESVGRLTKKGMIILINLKY